jgi:hypothetical protein
LRRNFCAAANFKYQREVTGVGTQESGVAGVAEYASKVFIRKSGPASPGKILAKLPDSLAPELLQLLTPEFRKTPGSPGWRC